MGAPAPGRHATAYSHDVPGSNHVDAILPGWPLGRDGSVSGATQIRADPQDHRR